MKVNVSDLAIFGGRPAFADALHVGRPNIGDRARLIARIHGMLDRRWLSNDGPMVREFEARVAEIAGVDHCIATCSGTMALELAVRATGLGGEVITPAFTFVAAAQSLHWLGITPVFCEIAPDGHSIDPARVEELITPRTTGIIATHLWGRPSATEALAAIAAKHGLRLLFDAAHAFGCTNMGRPIGRFGDAEVFSFHATKFVNSGEGGAVVTNDGGLADRLRLMRNFGFVTYDHVVAQGINGKMSELSAAMGLTSLEAMDEVVETNRRNYDLYRRALSDVPGLEFVTHDERERCNYQYVVVEIDETRAGISRDRLVETLHAENAFARRYFYPGCHRMEPFVTLFPDAATRLPQTDAVAARVMALPTGTGVSADDIEVIGSIVRCASASASRARFVAS